MAHKSRSEKTETIDDVSVQEVPAQSAPAETNDDEVMNEPAAEAPDGAAPGEAAEGAPPKPKRRRRTRSRSAAGKGDKAKGASKSDQSAEPDSADEKAAGSPTEDVQPEAGPDEDQPVAEAADEKPRIPEVVVRKPARPASRDEKPARQSRATSSKAAPTKPSKLQMLISYIPGEECRVAVVEDGQLEEFHAERAASMSRVGNIYVGRVTNVEPAIQAAFVDFGVDHHGFLHVSDVHPRYFPGEDNETTESVGKKTPRRERPPIQKCFRRGDEVLVQVLKEGVGTKGPTLTSYLSVPGRFLVMMPQMDKVGVSRKVEDEDQRREMRKILDQLELPEGFGFILRTAGMERTKMELKRDLAYLLRLWKDMEARRGSGNKPRLLYSESDLLVRALRDMLAPEIDEVVIDNELALARAARFLKIVAPRSKVRLLQYSGQTPLFHAFGVEQQIAQMHAREVPLPGGGRLVIDETEALVAIDVNSGKMRDARDAETNAYRTNCEAVEVICRQLKLRDLGGIVINDLIDMRLASHRKDVEQRFRDRLKRDRARSTILPISGFGILEMTRQRMRGSHETVHFGDCPTCRGRGIVQKPDSVASDALRNLAAMLDYENVARVEMVVSPRVASELLSSRRKTLNKLERASGKHVDVRVSETVAIDRVSFYAYDATGADIDIDQLPRTKPPRDLKVWELPRSASDEEWATDLKDEEVVEDSDLSPGEQAELADMPAHPIEIEDSDEDVAAGAAENGEAGRKRRRRRRRRGGRSDNGEAGAQPQAPARASGEAAAPSQPAATPAATPAGEAAEGEGAEGGPRRRRRRRRRRGGRDGAPAAADDGTAAQDAEAPEEEAVTPADLEGPRGDSWDLPPQALPRLTPPPAAAKVAAPAKRPEETMEPGGQAPETPAALVDSELEPPAEADELSEGSDEADASEMEKPAGERGEGRGRRRRRGRGGQRSGEKPRDGERPRESEKPEQRRDAKPAQAREADPKKPKTEVRVSGGYKRKTSAAPTPAAPAAEPRPRPAAAPAPATPAAKSPAPQSGQPARPKRVLYTSRRKLTPAELARRPKPE